MNLHGAVWDRKGDIGGGDSRTIGVIAELQNLKLHPSRILTLLLWFSEIMRSNGFCLANTETIVIDHSIPNGKDQHLGVDPAEHL